MIDWLLAPIDAARSHEVGFFISWHGRLMVLAWGFLFPLGVLVARFFKIFPGQNWPSQLDSKIWWHGHLSLQYAGGAAMLLGIGFVWWSPSNGSAVSTLHWLGGYAVLILAAAQFVAGWLRGSKGGPTAPRPNGSITGDHYNMTLRRRVFEYYHKFAGYVTLATAFITLHAGLWLANAPRWMWLVLSLWWLVLAALFAMLQRRGLAVDTYQAIWGRDQRHPGNKHKPIGWGIQRRVRS